MSAETATRLAAYGSLRPGLSNHQQLAGLNGEWIAGRVQGHLVAEGWGPGKRYPGLVLDACGEDIEVEVFLSRDLPDHWARLDAFEGPTYRRTVVQVSTARGPLDAYIYVAAVVAPNGDASRS